MALVHRNRYWRGLTWAVAVATLQYLQPAHAAAVKSGEPVELTASGSSRKADTDTVTFSNPIITQGRTLLKAEKGEGTNMDEGLDDSAWNFTGNVHLEFDGAVLDAQAATAVFLNGRLSSVVLQAVAPQRPKKLVHVVFKSAVLDVENATVTLAEGRIRTIQALGTPTQFSYRMKKQGPVSGRADKIEYDAVTDSIVFSGDTRYTDGKKVASTSALTYNFSDGSTTTGTINLIVPREDRVPAPRTPDRATAK